MEVNIKLRGIIFVKYNSKEILISFEIIGEKGLF